MFTCEVLTIGRADYDSTLSLQKELLARKKGGEQTDYLILVEHDPVITVGRKGSANDLRVDADVLKTRGIQLRVTSRGGATTYHGPGQLVGYPIMDLRRHGKDVHQYLRSLEQCLIDTLAKRNIAAARCEGKTGVWVGSAKIGSIGIAVRGWITYHGFAMNVGTELAGFDSIFPCGMPDCRMTSVSQEQRRKVTIQEFAREFLPVFAGEFGCTIAEEQLVHTEERS